MGPYRVLGRTERESNVTIDLPEALTAGHPSLPHQSNIEWSWLTRQAGYKLCSRLSTDSYQRSWIDKIYMFIMEQSSQLLWKRQNWTMKARYLRIGPVPPRNIEHAALICDNENVVLFVTLSRQIITDVVKHVLEAVINCVLPTPI